ncbi:hypothetical protein BV20DRAFT_123797 [Pilatotrama ljubarskyi]|nr:hypothetical protein BV20DRAFT_123797 [Pilatotrama ljubarskyi]
MVSSPFAYSCQVYDSPFRRRMPMIVVCLPSVCAALSWPYCVTQVRVVTIMSAMTSGRRASMATGKSTEHPRAVTYVGDATHSCVENISHRTRKPEMEGLTVSSTTSGRPCRCSTQMSGL